MMDLGFYLYALTIEIDGVRKCKAIVPSYTSAIKYIKVTEGEDSIVYLGKLDADGNEVVTTKETAVILPKVCIEKVPFYRIPEDLDKKERRWKYGQNSIDGDDYSCLY